MVGRHPTCDSLSASVRFPPISETGTWGCKPVLTSNLNTEAGRALPAGPPPIRALHQGSALLRSAAPLPAAIPSSKTRKQPSGKGRSPGNRTPGRAGYCKRQPSPKQSGRQRAGTGSAGLSADSASRACSTQEAPSRQHPPGLLHTRGQVLGEAEQQGQEGVASGRPGKQTVNRKKEKRE